MKSNDLTAHARSVQLFCSLGLGLLLAVCVSLVYIQWCDFSNTCATVRADTLRLHVQANSNSIADQTVKLKVRDACLAQMESFAVESLEDAVQTARVALPAFALIAQKTLREAGVEDTVTAYVTTMYFGTTEYQNFTLPAGEYTALRIEIGAHQGKNWWCVLYPQMCLSAAGEGYAQESENALIAGDYQIRFAAVEWFEKLKRKTEHIL